MAITERDIKRLVRKIFTPGPPRRGVKPARRLELKDGNEKGLCGWGEKPLVDFICRELKIERGKGE